MLPGFIEIASVFNFMDMLHLDYSKANLLFDPPKWVVFLRAGNIEVPTIKRGFYCRDVLTAFMPRMNEISMRLLCANGRAVCGRCVSNASGPLQW